MATPVVKRSFNAGEIAPTLWQRTDVEKLDAGCRYIKNFLIHEHGAVYRRPGFVKWAIVEQAE